MAIRKIAIMTSSKELKNANRAPDKMPGLIIGKVILKKVRSGLAPKFIEACSSVVSKLASVEETTTTT